MSKTVYKPWGKEVWLELNDRYCYKRIYINAGHRTSLQYHHHKLETNYIISGVADITLDDQVIRMMDNDFFTVKPGVVHRVHAITDIILQEVSTPEVDDVIRVQDDTGRGDGKLERESVKQAACILAAGIGSRMGDLGDHTNKSLIPVDNQAVLSHIFSKLPQDTDIIIAVGHKADLVREYCETAHPCRKITFVNVENYEGPGTGPGASLKCCKEHLQRSFYVITADSLLDEQIPPIDGNWLGTAVVEDLENYSTVQVDEGGRIVAFKNKSKDPHPFAFTGICAILDHEVFWEQLEKHSDGELVSAFFDTAAYKTLNGKCLKWHDTGTKEKYLKIRNERPQIALPKTNEITYCVKENGGKLYVKFNSNSETIQNVVSRAKELDPHVPKIFKSGKNFYSYNWSEGSTLYNRLERGKAFIDWCQENLWKSAEGDLKDVCHSFYFEKTMHRAKQYLDKKPMEFVKPKVVDGVQCRYFDEMLNDIDFKWLCETSLKTKTFHGDLQFDNVLAYSDNFRLLDWRPDFGGQTEFGDVYYDLAKLYGGMLINYGVVKTGQDLVAVCGSETLELRHCTNEALSSLRQWYEQWLVNKGYSLDKVLTLTGLIFLNMAPLHESPFDDYLFYYSRKILEGIIFSRKLLGEIAG